MPFRIASHLVLLFALANLAQAGPVIGTFASSRVGDASLVDGSLLVDFRTSIGVHFPASTIVGTEALTADFLADVNVLIISNVVGVGEGRTILSTEEQAALRSYVNAGGNALIMPYSFPPNVLDFGDPFEMLLSGGVFTGTATMIPDPSGNPITNGPFGLVSEYFPFGAGRIKELGPYAEPIVYVEEPFDLGFLHAVIAIIPSNAIQPGSGRVVFIADPGALANISLEGFDDGNFSRNEILALNALAFLVPEPASQSLFAVGLIVLIGQALRPRLQRQPKTNCIRTQDSLVRR